MQYRGGGKWWVWFHTPVDSSHIINFNNDQGNALQIEFPFYCLIIRAVYPTKCFKSRFITQHNCLWFRKSTTYINGSINRSLISFSSEDHFANLASDQCRLSYNFGTTRGASHGVTMWSRVMSLSERQPLNAIVSSNSSWSIWSTLRTPASPWAAKANSTGLPIWN